VNKLRNTIQKGKEDKAEHKLKMKQLKEAKKDIGRARRHEMMESLRMRVQEKRDQDRADRQEEADRRERSAERARQVVGDVAKLGAAAYGIYSLKKSYDSTRDALEEGPLSGARSAFRTASQIRQTASAAGDQTARSPEATTSRSGNTSTERVTNRIPENVSAAIRSNSSTAARSLSDDQRNINSAQDNIRNAMRTVDNQLSASSARPTSSSHSENLARRQQLEGLSRRLDGLWEQNRNIRAKMSNKNLTEGEFMNLMRQRDQNRSKMDTVAQLAGMSPDQLLNILNRS
jgi:hypothetical protein